MIEVLSIYEVIYNNSYHKDKVCRLDDVQLEDDIGYIKSSNTDLSSSN